MCGTRGRAQYPFRDRGRRIGAERTHPHNVTAAAPDIPSNGEDRLRIVLLDREASVPIQRTFSHTYGERKSFVVSRVRRCCHDNGGDRMHLRMFCSAARRFAKES